MALKIREPKEGDSPIHDRRTLFRQQRSKCAGCGFAFQFRDLQANHIVPLAKGGTGRLETYSSYASIATTPKGSGHRSTCRSTSAKSALPRNELSTMPTAMGQDMNVKHFADTDTRHFELYPAEVEGICNGGSLGCARMAGRGG